MAAKNFSNLRIQEFKTLTGYWVLYWIGRVYTDSELGTHTIETLFVQLSNGLSEYASYPALINNKEQTRYKRVSIYYSPFLLIGSVWKDGQFFNQPSAYADKIDIRLNNPKKLQTQYLIEITGRQELMPYPQVHNYYNYSILASREFCNLPNDIDFVLFPCFEIARKYHLKSDALSKKIFAGEIGPRETYYDESSEVGKVLTENTESLKHLVLTKEMYDSDAPFVARIQYNETARRSALQVWETLTMTMDERKKTVNCFFPFQEESELELAGKKIKLGNQTGFLVYQIINCSAPMLQGELRFTRANDARHVEGADLSELEQRENTPQAHTNNQDGPKGLTAENKPHHQTAKDPIVFSLDDGFSLPPTGKIPKEKIQSYSQGGNNYINNEAEDYSVNDTSSNDPKTTKAGIETQERIEAFSNFIDALNVLEENGVPTTYVYPTNQVASGQPSYYFTFSDKDLRGPLKNWCYLKKVHKNKWEAARSAIIAELNIDDQLFYLLEIERRKDSAEAYCTYLLQDISQMGIQESDFDTLLTEIAQNKGAINDNQKNFRSLNGRIRFKKIKHPNLIENRNNNHEASVYLLNAVKRLLINKQFM